ncbi:MAG TPA: S8 family serine peptidase, partial [Saprospiraceae bacterium]|nr:S8 family serine peptidase [Saprospiraceae bacterium]
MTIKFKSNVTDKEIASFETTHRLKMLRRAATGFIDYEIAPVQDIVVLHDELKGVEVIEAIQLNYLGNWYFQPNDPLVSLQWYLDKIQAFAAWDNSRGSQEIVVAVLDTGIDWSHPDFAGAIYSNSAEIPGNGLDDDDNGFVDDIHGWNFENNNSNINDLSGTQSFHGHGTRVSGIIGAQLNNSIGIAGIGGGIRIMPVKVGSEGPLSSIVDDAILYAAQNGAKIINMSFGWQSVVEDNP